MQLLLWLHRRRWDELCAAWTSLTKHQSSLNEGILHVSRWVFTCPNTGILRINLSRQVKPRFVRELSVVQNARIFLKKCLKPSTVCHCYHFCQALLIRGPRIYGTHETSLFSQHVDKCFWTTLIPVKVSAVTSWETPVVGPSHFGSSSDIFGRPPVCSSNKSPWFPISSTRSKCWTCSVDVGLQISPGIAADMTLSILFSNKCEQ